eukprot:8860077-Alexandrium_andersonii.AAC.1
MAPPDWTPAGCPGRRASPGCPRHSQPAAAAPALGQQGAQRPAPRCRGPSPAGWARPAPAPRRRRPGRPAAGASW